MIDLILKSPNRKWVLVQHILRIAPSYHWAL